MRFFTPDLIVRFNSDDADVAASADDEWEAVLKAYESHLDGVRDRLPTRALDLCDLDLHDAELPPTGWPVGPDAAIRVPAADGSATWTLQVMLPVHQGDQHTLIVYRLWDEVRVILPADGWPFSRRRPHWLYDELDSAGPVPGRFVHRILLSDGRTLVIPFNWAGVQQSMPHLSASLD